MWLIFVCRVHHSLHIVQLLCELGVGSSVLACILERTGRGNVRLFDILFFAATMLSTLLSFIINIYGFARVRTFVIGGGKVQPSKSTGTLMPNDYTYTNTQLTTWRSGPFGLLTALSVARQSQSLQRKQEQEPGTDMSVEKSDSSQKGSRDTNPVASPWQVPSVPSSQLSSAWTGIVPE
jgi:hypothetical protein